ncbi:putative Heat shock protein 70 family [Helianthus annuus]|nr:putative Heat shock protein 70 family [Helianthus annuus]
MTLLSGAYRSFATDSEKEVLTNNLQETEDWLYEDSDDESGKDYTGKLKDLKKLLEPIENRYMEENALAKATETLQICIARYHSHSDSLPADMKDNVKNVCTEAEQWLIDLSQKQLSPKTLLTEINHAIITVKRECQSITRSKSSSSRHEKHVDSENAMAKAIKPLQACIANCYSLAESLPDAKKEKIIDVCIQAEKWLNGRSQNHASPKTLSTDINRAIELLRV